MKLKINVSIDDVSPHKKIGLDAVHRILNVIDKFSGLKVSLFIPTAIRRYASGDKKSYCLEDYPKFVDQLKALPPANFEICYHGHKHGNKSHRKNNDEFRYLKRRDALDILNRSRQIFDHVGLKARKVFRPPGFWLSKDSFGACSDFGIKVLALHRAKRYRKCYKGCHETYNHVVYVSKQKPDFPNEFEMLYHAGRDQKDCFNKRKSRELIEILNKKKEKISFIFMEEFHGQNR